MTSPLPTPGAPPTLTAEDACWLPAEDPSDAGSARRAATDIAATLAFPDHRIAEVALVVTEIATNLCKHAERGTVLLRRLRAGDAAGVGVVAIDAGPGMLDLPGAVMDGTSTTGTLGVGLGAITRLSSSWDLHSVPGLGTVLTATLWSGAPPEPIPGRDDAAGLTRPMGGESECGDAVAVRWVDGEALLLHVDGLGHGPLAARAAAEAVRLFVDASDVEPAAILTRLHRGLSHTRGAVAAVVSVDRRRGRVRHAAVGNISGTIADGERRRGLVSQPGIVGHTATTVRQYEQGLPDDAAVILHSDGLRDAWDLRDYPGVLRHEALVVAATLLRHAGVRRDDASVLVDLPPRLPLRDEIR